MPTKEVYTMIKTHNTSLLGTFRIVRRDLDKGSQTKTFTVHADNAWIHWIRQQDDIIYIGLEPAQVHIDPDSPYMQMNCPYAERTTTVKGTANIGPTDEEFIEGEEKKALAAMRNLTQGKSPEEVQEWMKYLASRLKGPDKSDSSSDEEEEEKDEADKMEADDSASKKA